MIKKLILLFSSLIVLTSWMAKLADQGEDSNAKLKALYIYNFTKNIEWPSDYKLGNFVVGIVGNNQSLLTTLTDLASKKTVGAQKIEIKNVATMDEASKCHIVYILPENSSQLTDVVNKVKNKSTLIVTEKPGLTKLGAGINFVIVESKLKFELNKTSIENHNLKVASSLESLAVK